MQEIKSVLKKAKLLTSNFTVEEQIDASIKTISSFKNTFELFTNFNNSFYSGIATSHIAILYKNESTGLLFKKEGFVTTLPASVLLAIYSFLEESDLNRIFHILKEGDKIRVDDSLFYKSVLIDSDEKLNDFDFYIDSRLFYYFKLNRKTINKHTNIHIFENCFVISSIRKKKEILFLYSYKSIS